MHPAASPVASQIRRGINPDSKYARSYQDLNCGGGQPGPALDLIAILRGYLHRGDCRSDNMNGIAALKNANNRTNWRIKNFERAEPSSIQTTRFRIALSIIRSKAPRISLPCDLRVM